MPQYDFRSLSSQDFEELVRDLLQAEWNIALESFRAGRDQGVDLRYAPAFGGTTIVQCKHYAVSGYAKLLSNLRDHERPKVVRLNPTRYVIVTSAALTPANKDEIVSCLSPFVRAAGDVLGADDIEGLLARHSEVERRNFKLWLTSTEVIERVLHNAELCQTDFEIDRIRRKLPLFVQSAAYPRAMQLLDDTRIVIVSGVPGIGKTTLAEMLLYAHLERGYEPVKIQGEIAEGKKLFKPNSKKIFYYDDFLGQTFLGDRKEYLGRNEDVALVNFIEMVRQSAHSRFLLTTREHILRNALQVSEKLAQSPVLEHRCVLELRDYAIGKRARILYNHLYFSDLPQAYKDAVLEDDFFLKIIRHENFNPRLIEWLSSHVRVAAIAPSAYKNYITNLMEKPESIWAHAFRNQISESARTLLYSVYSLGEWIDVVDLELPFLSLRRYRSHKYHYSTAPSDFLTALEEMDGAFLLYKSGHVSFLNPSIREFIASLVASEQETVQDIISAALRVKQIEHLWDIGAAHPEGMLPGFLRSNAKLVLENLSRVLNGPETRWERRRDGSHIGHPIDTSKEWRIAFLLKIADGWHSTQFLDLAAEAADTLVRNWEHSRVDFLPILRLLNSFNDNKWVQENGGYRIYRALLDGFLDGLELAHGTEWDNILKFPESAMEWKDADEALLSAAIERYRTHGVDSDIDGCNSFDEIVELKEALEGLETKFGFDFSREVRRLDSDISERGEPSDELMESGRAANSGGVTDREFVSDDDIRQMFGTLSEPK